MDPKFLFILLGVEIGFLIFNSIQMGASEIHVYSAYNQLPVITAISSASYSCFHTINYCVFGNTQQRFLNIIDLLFISLIVICYSCLITILLRKWENVKIRSNLRITWYVALELLILLIIALRVLLMIIRIERNIGNTHQCSRQNNLVRIENAFTHFFLSIVEAAYIGFDLVNQQTTPRQNLNQTLKHQSEENKNLRFPLFKNISHQGRTSRQ